MSKYLIFDDKGVIHGKKTRLVYVCAKSDRANLGTIRWFAPWRQYCFFPLQHRVSIFNPQCLHEIAEHCQELTAAQRGSKLHGNE